MLASINPLGERARRTRWGRTMTWYLIGSTAGGTAVGALAGAVGVGLRAALDPSDTAAAIVAATLAAAGVVLELGLAGRSLPTTRRQVNEDWLAKYRGWVYGTGFGFQLGLGVATVVTTATVYVAIAFAVLTGSVVGGIAVGATFGFVRALPLLAVRRANDVARVHAALRRAAAWSGRAHALAVAGLVGVAAAGLLAVVV
jgi:Cytochrome C biogenesis protein transmembrane region